MVLRETGFFPVGSQVVGKSLSHRRLVLGADRGSHVIKVPEFWFPQRRGFLPEAARSGWENTESTTLGSLSLSFYALGWMSGTWGTLPGVGFQTDH